MKANPNCSHCAGAGKLIILASTNKSEVGKWTNCTCTLKREYHQYTEEEESLVLKMLRGGCRNIDIAKATGIKIGKISQIKNKNKIEGTPGKIRIRKFLPDMVDHDGVVLAMLKTGESCTEMSDRMGVSPQLMQKVFEEMGYELRWVKIKKGRNENKS